MHAVHRPAMLKSARYRAYHYSGRFPAGNGRHGPGAHKEVPGHEPVAGVLLVSRRSRGLRCPRYRPSSGRSARCPASTGSPRRGCTHLRHGTIASALRSGICGKFHCFSAPSPGSARSRPCSEPRCSGVLVLSPPLSAPLAFLRSHDAASPPLVDGGHRAPRAHSASPPPLSAPTCSLTSPFSPRSAGPRSPPAAEIRRDRRLPTSFDHAVPGMRRLSVSDAVSEHFLARRCADRAVAGAAIRRLRRAGLGIAVF